MPDSASVTRLNQLLEQRWEQQRVSPTPQAGFYTLARRLSLGLTGAVPSLEELRRLEITPSSDQFNAWLDYMLNDQRSHAYLAERLARVYVGVESGPFLVYRRHRLVTWITEQLASNRPYDAMSRELIASRGIWTTSPAANFITVAATGGDQGNIDEVKLAARTSRAFLGISLDCMQCHDDKFGDHWKQKDFHQLAAFFGKTGVGLSGVQDGGNDYQTRYKGKKELEPVAMEVPFERERFQPLEGQPREALARWITDRENSSFSRAVANRAWALLFGRPLITPIDNIPVEGSGDPVLEFLAGEFVNSGHDLRALFRLIANSAAFLRSSQSEDPENPVTEAQEIAWAAFPLTQLRPEQVSGSIIQSSSPRTLDSETHILQKIRRLFETRAFIGRYGDKGEGEFHETTSTIPQRLLLLNGNLVHDRTKPDDFMNSASRVATLVGDPQKVVEAAFLSVLTRHPREEEREYFCETLSQQKRDPERRKAISDLYWALINSTEFSWNR